MNGLPWTLTVLAVGGLIASLGAMWIGYRLEQRSTRPPDLHGLVPVCLCHLCLTDEDAAIIDHARRGAW